MSFNPTLPVTNSEMRSEEMRNQFNGLKDLIDENIPASEKGAADGVASLDASGLLEQQVSWDKVSGKPTPVADGTYTVGLGTATNGTITIVGGIITAVQEATNAPLTARVTGAGTPEWNGDYVYAGDFNGKPSFTKDGTHSIWWESFVISVWRFSPTIGDTSDTAYQSTDDTANPWDVTTWNNVPGTGDTPVPTVAQV